MTFDQWFTQYMSLYKPKLKPKTRAEYERMHSKDISPALGSIALEAITPEDVQALVNAVAARGSRQAQAVFMLVRAVLRRAVRTRKIRWNPCDALDKPEHDPSEGRALDDDAYALAAELAEDDLAIALALYGGLRRGEILGLRWADVDLKNGLLHVRRNVQRVGGKLVASTTKSAAGARDLPIAPQLLPILRDWYRLIPSAPCVPCAPETLDRRWRRAQLRAGIADPYRLHDLRHTYGTKLVLSGCNLRIVQYLMGHASLEVTARTYIHITAKDAFTETARVYASLQ